MKLFIQSLRAATLLVALLNSSTSFACDKESSTNTCSCSNAQKEVGHTSQEKLKNDDPRAQVNLQRTKDSKSTSGEFGRHGRGALARQVILQDPQ